MEQRIQGIIFDLDGTLYHMNFMKLRMTLRLWTTLPYLRRLSAARSAVRDQTYGSQDELLADLYRELACRVGGSSADAERWYQRVFMTVFVRLLRSCGHVQRELASLIQTLRQRGVRVAVLSDFGHVPERLEALGLHLQWFDTLGSAEAYGALKPSPIAALAISKDWAIPPERILVVGDRPDRDGTMALQAGMQFVGIGKKDNHFSCYRWSDASKLIEARTVLE